MIYQGLSLHFPILKLLEKLRSTLLPVLLALTQIFSIFLYISGQYNIRVIHQIISFADIIITDNSKAHNKRKVDIFQPEVESDIETCGFSDIIFASKTRGANIT